MHPDTFARHSAAAALVEGSASVLDVGGVAGALAAFARGRTVVTANVRPPADVLFDGRELPFDDDSFDAVTSLDVLEHVPPADRSAHIRELARVARELVVLCTPLGTAEHAAAERALAEEYERTAGRPHPFLAEHVEHGLATEAELFELASSAGLDAELRFQGDYRDNERLMRLGGRARRNPVALVLYLVLRLVTRAPVELDLKSTPYTNRVFLIGRRRPA
jgi:hypothetical protein